MYFAPTIFFYRNIISIFEEQCGVCCAVGGCDVLENPENGAVATSGLAPGSTATYTCDPGYELVGTALQTCGSDGEWSDVPPTCSRMLKLIGKTLIFWQQVQMVFWQANASPMIACVY